MTHPHLKAGQPRRAARDCDTPSCEIIYTRAIKCRVDAAISCRACEMDNTFFLKVALLGSRCGKTEMYQRYVHQRFSSMTRPTIGVDFGVKELHLSGQQTARIQIWDIASAERYSNMSRIYLRDSMGVFIAFDCTQPKSLESALLWRQAASRLLSESIHVILLMTKCDLQRHPEIPTGHAMSNFCATHGFAAFFETSARDAEHQVCNAHAIIRTRYDIDIEMPPLVVASMPDCFSGYQRSVFAHD